MKLGDTVISKQTGYPASGVVIGLVVAPLYIGQKDVSLFYKWNDIYPDWTSKPIVYVWFKEPIRTMTFEEYMEHLPEEMKQYDAKTLYEMNVVKTSTVAYPIDDLEVLE